MILSLSLRRQSVPPCLIDLSRVVCGEKIPAASPRHTGHDQIFCCCFRTRKSGQTFRRMAVNSRFKHDADYAAEHFGGITVESIFRIPVRHQSPMLEDRAIKRYRTPSCRFRGNPWLFSLYGPLICRGAIESPFACNSNRFIRGLPKFLRRYPKHSRPNFIHNGDKPGLPG